MVIGSAGAIYVAAVGARTPLGLQAAASAASVRAALSAVQRHPYLVDNAGNLMPVTCDAQLDPTLIGPRRLLALLEPALREAALPLVSQTGDSRGITCDEFRLAVSVGLPEIRPGFSANDAAAVCTGIESIVLPLPARDAEVHTLGHAAGLVALARIAQRIVADEIDLGLVAGVDSYLHPYTMEWLDANRQVIGSISRSGFVPGEGAGACLLASGRACERLGLTPPMRLRDAVIGRESALIKSQEMCFGVGLTATLRQAVRSLRLPDERIHHTICDLNGERYRGEEWGFVCLRASECFDDPTDYLAPADCWGDLGAASGPLFVMLACQAIARGYSNGRRRTAVWASSEGGCRGVALLESMA